MVTLDGKVLKAECSGNEVSSCTYSSIASVILPRKTRKKHDMGSLDTAKG